MSYLFTTDSVFAIESTSLHRMFPENSFGEDD